MSVKRLLFISCMAFILLVEPRILLGASAPSIRFVRSITESGGVPLFRDPLQMSLQVQTGELAVVNSGRGDVVILRTGDEKVLLRIDRRSGLYPPFGISLNRDKTILVGALKGGEVRLLEPTGIIGGSWDLSKVAGHTVRPGRIRHHGSGAYLIMDRQNDQLLILNHDGTLQAVIGKPKELDQLQDAVVGPEGHLYALCNGGKTVRVFTKQGKFLYGFGKHAASAENFSFPCALAFDTKQRLWIVDAFQHKLKIFTRKGDFLFQFGGIGTAPNQLFFPVDMAFDGRGRLWVLEKGANRIKIYEVEDLKK